MRLDGLPELWRGDQCGERLGERLSRRLRSAARPQQVLNGDAKRQGDLPHLVERRVGEDAPLKIRQIRDRDTRPFEDVTEGHLLVPTSGPKAATEFRRLAAWLRGSSTGRELGHHRSDTVK